MQVKEEKICSFTQKNYRLQLIKLTSWDYDPSIVGDLARVIIKYQVRLNRKIIETSISEYQMRKLFAIYCQNIVLQLKIY